MANEQLENLRKWQRARTSLEFQANWRVGALFHLKPKANMVEKYLRELDLRYTMFENSQQMFQHIEKKKDIGLIFCDWEPQKARKDETGLDFLESYRKFTRLNTSTKNIPVILVTYHFTSKDLIPAIRNGAKDVLILPTTMTILGQKVLENLNRVEEKLKMLMETDELMSKAEEFVRTGNYHEAINIYQEVIQEHGSAVDVLEKQAEAHLRAGQVDAAIQCFTQCVAIGKSNTRAYQGLGNCYSLLGQHGKARECYKKVIELEPENAFVDHKIGRTYLMENNPKGAQRHLEDALKRNPHFFEIYQDLAGIKCANQEESVAVDILRDFISQYPADMRGHIEYAETLIKAERYPEAEAAIQEGINQANKDNYQPPVALYNRWGIALRKQDKYREAILKYELALKLEPDNPEVHFNIAKAYFESGDRSDIVVKKFKECFSRDPSLKEDLWDDKLLTPLYKYFPKPAN